MGKHWQKIWSLRYRWVASQSRPRPGSRLCDECLLIKKFVANIHLNRIFLASRHVSKDVTKAWFSHAKPELTRMMVRAVGVEPTRALRPCGFSYRLRLSPP